MVTVRIILGGALASCSPLRARLGAFLLAMWRQPRLSTRTIRSPSTSNHDPRHAITAAQTMTVNRLQRYVAPRPSQHDSKIAVATGQERRRYLAIIGRLPPGNGKSHVCHVVTLTCTLCVHLARYFVECSVRTIWLIRLATARIHLSESSADMIYV